MKNLNLLILFASLFLFPITCGATAASFNAAAIKEYQTLKAASLEECIKSRQASATAGSMELIVVEPKAKGANIKCLGIYDSCTASALTKSAIMFWLNKDGSVKKTRRICF